MVFTARSPIAAEECLALAPTAAADDSGSGIAGRFDDKIGSVRDELAVHSENRALSAFHLGRRIVPRLQRANG